MIVEGILLLKILSEVGRTPDFLVFVHRASHHSSLVALTQSYLREYDPRQKANFIVKWSSAQRDREIALAHQNHR